MTKRLSAASIDMHLDPPAGKPSEGLRRRGFLKASAAFSLLGSAGCLHAEARQGRSLPDWREGYLDIHHIATGRGETAFMILPDGTTMLIDLGDITDGWKPEALDVALPSAARSPAEWVARYIAHYTKPLNQSQPVIDQVMLTHFHSDHIGWRHPNTTVKHGYALSGITELAESLEIRRLVDRGFPEYAFPSRAATKASNKEFFEDYLAFVDHQREKRKALVEGFEVGSGDQFQLRRNPARYPEFKIRNFAGNGKVWSGTGTGTRTTFTAADKLDENCCSCAIKLSYGNFSYWSGGDMPGYSGKRDVESHVAPLVGRVDAMLLNHHGYKDSINPLFLKTLRPRIIVGSSWEQAHPHPETLARMRDRTIYAQDRRLFATTLMADERRRADLALGAAGAEITTGHIVIRVYPGGSHYQVFVLDSLSEERLITEATEKMPSLGNLGIQVS